MAAVAAGKWSNPNSGPGTPYLPFGITTLPLGPTYDPTAGISGVPLASSAAAFNQVDGMYATGNDPFWYWVNASYGTPNPGLLDGGVAVQLTGQLVFYFKVYWQSYGTVTPTSPMPTSLSLLVKTQLKASANVSYGSSGLTSGLAASATATDGPPFNETASASAGDAAASAGPASLAGYHLVTAAFAPLGSNTGIAQVSLNGTAKYQASNTVPYGTYTIVNPGTISGKKTNGQTSADAEGSVLAGVKLYSASLQAHSTVDTSAPGNPWDPAHPRFFSGTNCSASGTAAAMSGYVSHAQLLVGGIDVKDYYDTAFVGHPAAGLNVTLGTNQGSASLQVYFDSTYFADASNVPIKMLVTDQPVTHTMPMCRPAPIMKDMSAMSRQPILRKLMQW